MRYRALSPTGDYQFGNGQLDFLINSPEAVAQAVETYLRLFLGEWFLNVNDGTPWLEGVFGYNSQEEADQTLIQTILAINQNGQLLVQDLNNWQSTVDPKTRSYSSLSATLDTIYGQTQLQMENLGALT
jgi:hypothetical protein